jgi:DNA-binding CsgD family transcriptional regulator
MGEHFMDSGDFQRAEQLICEALPGIAEHRPDAAPLFEGSLVPLALRRGALDDAGEHLEASLAYHREPPHRQPFAMAERLGDAARLAIRRGVPEEGARLFGLALPIFERGGFTHHERCGPLVATIEQELEAALGRERLVREMAIGRRMTVPEAIAMAAEIARMRSPAPEPVAAMADDGLTERQREILRLLVAGRSNAAIADALFISERTVTTHLTRIYDRLGVATRAEAIARAHQLGIRPA